MQVHEFKAFLNSFRTLTPTQVIESIEGLHEVRRRVEAICEIERCARVARVCRHCASEASSKWGRTRTEIQRYRCRTCRKTFTGRTGTSIARLYQPGLFLDLVKDIWAMVSPQPSGNWPCG